jgi:hypothetical protein
MRALTIVTFTFGLFAAASIATSATAQDAQRILKVLKAQPAKDLKDLGSQVSTVTTYSAQREGGGGPATNCSARCTSGTELRWQCPHDPAAIAVHCVPHCSPPPAHGMCFYE